MTSQPANARRETVVLLHSLGTDHTLWDAQVSALTDRFQVLTPDSLGHGQRGDGGPISIDAWVKDLDQVIAPLRQPVHLAGLSMGGIQAIAYASRYPDKVRSLVLANTFAAIDAGAAETKIASIGDAISAMGMTRYARQYLQDTLTSEVDDAAQARLSAAIARVSAEAYLQSSQATFRADLLGRLKLISAPTLVMIGDRDQKTPLPLSETLVERIANARLAVVPNAGHLSNVDAPEAFNQELLRFLNETRSEALTS